MIPAKSLLAILSVLVLSGGWAACSSEPRATTEEERASGFDETPVEHAAVGSADAETTGKQAAIESGALESRGEHAGSEGGEGEGEESGVYISRGDTWDTIRRGARLVLSFDPASDAFTGRVANTTGSRLCGVRVEVHLSGGTELGPTARTDLPSGHSIEVELPAGGAAFDTWTAHPEISRCSGG